MVHRLWFIWWLVAMLAVGGCDGVLDPLGDPNGDDDVADDDDTTAADDDTSDDDVDDDDSAGPVDLDGDGWTEAAGDCNDSDPAIHPDADELACDAIDNDCDGLGAGEAAGEVDGLEYPTLADAADALVDGSTLQICPGTHTERLWILSGLQVTITSASGDASDTILDGEGTHRAILCEQDTDVTLTDLTIQNGFGDYEVPDSTFRGGGGMVFYGHRLTVQRVTFADNTTWGWNAEGGAVLFDAAGTIPGPHELWLQDCRFENNRTDSLFPEIGWSGGAVYARSHDGLAVSVQDSDFFDNEATWDGVGIHLSAAQGTVTASFDGCHFEGNVSAYGSGGAIHASASGDEVALTVSNSTFIDNVVGHEGGAIHIEGDPSLLTVEDSSFLTNGNETVNGNYGGAICVQDWEAVDISGTEFTGNYAVSSGGAVLLDDPASLAVSASITDSTFQDNTSEYGGGALGIHQSGWDHVDVALENVTFSGNQASYGSGAFDIQNGDGSAEVTISISYFEQNTGYSGGAISSSDGQMEMEVTDSTFISNEAEFASALNLIPSGGFYIVEVVDSQFESNVATSASWDGGLVWMNEDTTLTFDSCSVTANTGGGVHIDDDFPTFFHSIDSDWGTGVDDNDPFDVAIYEDLTYTAYGGNETFTCNVTNGCH